MEQVRDRLRRELAEVDWEALRSHAGRDALIVVACELDLVEVALRVAADDEVQVGEWIREGRLGKPNREQLAGWEAHPDTSFSVLIAQPYVLVQESAGTGTVEE